MSNVHYDAMGQQYKVYAADGDVNDGGYNISREVAGDVVDLLSRDYMARAKEKSYSVAVNEVLKRDPALKKAYVGI